MAGRIFTIVLIVGGIGVMTYIFTNIGELLMQGGLREAFRRLRMQDKIEKMSGHFIVCGASRPGLSVCEELAKTNRPFVLVVLEDEEVKKYMKQDWCAVAGDASTSAVLAAAGIGRASGIFCALSNDKDNAFIAITARGLNQAVKIITVQNEHDAEMRDKLQRAGADIVINPSHIGGLRMASELIRPTVVSFLDVMLRDRERNLRIDEIRIPEGSSSIGVPLNALGLDRIPGALLLAEREADGSWHYNPPRNEKVRAGMVLIFLGSPDDARALCEHLGGEMISMPRE